MTLTMFRKEDSKVVELGHNWKKEVGEKAVHKVREYAALAGVNEDVVARHFVELYKKMLEKYPNDSEDSIIDLTFRFMGLEFFEETCGNCGCWLRHHKEVTYFTSNVDGKDVMSNVLYYCKAHGYYCVVELSQRIDDGVTSYHLEWRRVSVRKES